MATDNLPTEMLWRCWCTRNGVDEHAADAGQVTDFVLDLILEGRATDGVLAALVYAGEVTGTWCTSRYATLLLTLG